MPDERGPNPPAPAADETQEEGLAEAALPAGVELLPAVFEDYQFRLATGLAHAAPDMYRASHDSDGTEDDDVAEECAPPAYLTKAILRGRELAGEPRDVDY